MTEEQKLFLLEQLLRDKTVDYIFKLIVDLSDNQRLVLMKQLEDIQVFRRNKPRVYEINS